MKPKLRLLHGWGINRNVWNSLLPSLAPLYDVTLVDLPGYGDVVASVPFDKQAYQLESLARSILEANTTPSHWVAWSLGGTIALRMAQLAPSMFLSLQLVSTTPKFIATEDWRFGIEPEPFQQLAQSFEGDYSKTLKKFLLLQVNSDDPETRSQSRKLIRSLHASILELNSPTVEVLAAGLEVLRSTDLRNEIQNITIPVQIVSFPC